MKATQQTIQEIDRAIRKIIAKYPAGQDAVFTDIHLEVRPESGEMLAYDDDDKEINRCVIEQWIDNKDEAFYEKVTPVLYERLDALRPEVDQMSVLQPFSFVLVDGDHETLSDIYLVDDEQQIVTGDLLPDLEKDLNAFMKALFEE
ncbi:MAG: hypothetical protein MJZ35_05250 [Bacteroidaceae bacterium]|nr:hypothetical protein [Bacteroidaceae bacterium]